MSHKRQERRSIIRVKGEQRSARKDRIVVEEPMEIRIRQANQEADIRLNVTMRTPGHDFELTAGFLYAEGIVEDAASIGQLSHCLEALDRQALQGNTVRVRLAQGVKLSITHLQRHFASTSSCGVCGKDSIEALAHMPLPTLPPDVPQIDAATLLQLPGRLHDAQPLFAQTGGIHAAGLFNQEGELLSIREDIGRHNALDKLIGQQLLAQELPLVEHVVLLSSRIGFEMVQKAIRAGVPVLAAIGAPSSLAIELAESYGVTLIGFLREERFNIYTHPQRILLRKASRGD